MTRMKLSLLFVVLVVVGLFVDTTRAETPENDVEERLNHMDAALDAVPVSGSAAKADTRLDDMASELDSVIMSHEQDKYENDALSNPEGKDVEFLNKLKNKLAKEAKEAKQQRDHVLRETHKMLVHLKSVASELRKSHLREEEAAEPTTEAAPEESKHAQKSASENTEEKVEVVDAMPKEKTADQKDQDQEEQKNEEKIDKEIEAKEQHHASSEEKNEASATITELQNDDMVKTSVLPKGSIHTTTQVVAKGSLDLPTKSDVKLVPVGSVHVDKNGATGLSEPVKTTIVRATAAPRFREVLSEDPSSPVPTPPVSNEVKSTVTTVNNVNTTAPTGETKENKGEAPKLVTPKKWINPVYDVPSSNPNEVATEVPVGVADSEKPPVAPVTDEDNAKDNSKVSELDIYRCCIAKKFGEDAECYQEWCHKVTDEQREAYRKIAETENQGPDWDSIKRGEHDQFVKHEMLKRMEKKSESGSEEGEKGNEAKEEEGENDTMDMGNTLSELESSLKEMKQEFDRESSRTLKGGEDKGMHNVQLYHLKDMIEKAGRTIALLKRMSMSEKELDRVMKSGTVQQQVHASSAHIHNARHGLAVMQSLKAGASTSPSDVVSGSTEKASVKKHLKAAEQAVATLKELLQSEHAKDPKRHHELKMDISRAELTVSNLKAALQYHQNIEKVSKKKAEKLVKDDDSLESNEIKKDADHQKRTENPKHKVEKNKLPQVDLKLGFL